MLSCERKKWNYSQPKQCAWIQLPLLLHVSWGSRKKSTSTQFSDGYFSLRKLCKGGPNTNKIPQAAWEVDAFVLLIHESQYWKKEGVWSDITHPGYNLYITANAEHVRSSPVKYLAREYHTSSSFHSVHVLTTFQSFLKASCFSRCTGSLDQTQFHS